MRTAYAIVSSYSDRGTASSSVGRLRIAFKTEFVRGRQFRFQFGRDNRREVIWSDGRHTYTHWPSASLVGHPEIVDDGTDIGLALAAVAGTSSGTSVLVPAMLLPVSVGTVSSRFADLGELSVEGYELVATATCARVNARSPSAGLTKLWIDTETYLIRHMVVAGGLMDETTISYEPSIAPIVLESIVRPNVEKTAPQPRETPWTGVSIESGSRRIEAITEDSPAMRSGLVSGDEVEAVNGQRTEQFFDVIKGLHFVKIGEEVTLAVRRGDSTLEARVQVEAAPLSKRLAPSKPLVE
jgi:membrane-associated protease RseP (regulator of RpoE activity)